MNREISVFKGQKKFRNSAEYEQDKLKDLSAEEQAQKTKEFKLLTAIRELLVDPITREQYIERKRLSSGEPPTVGHPQTPTMSMLGILQSHPTLLYANFMDAQRRAAAGARASVSQGWYEETEQARKERTAQKRAQARSQRQMGEVKGGKLALGGSLQSRSSME